MLWGVAEDHDSNPIKLGLGKLKQRGAKVIAVNPVRSGYGAIADEWIGIRPGTDGLFAFALIHELLRMDRIDLDYLVRYANAHWLVIDNPGGADDGMFARDADGNALCWSLSPPLANAGGGREGVCSKQGNLPHDRATPPQPSPAFAREGADQRPALLLPRRLRTGTRRGTDRARRAGRIRRLRAHRAQQRLRTLRL
jgi:anaerobic selenocysteine-containing dehydrogenase